MSERYLDANGIRLAYDDFGNAEDPAILLIMGMATQMTAWPLSFLGFCRPWFSCNSF